MPYFLVTSKDITVINKDKSLRKLTDKDVLGLLPFTPDKAKKDEAYVIFDDADAAAEFALHGAKKEDPDHFPIFEVALKDAKAINAIKIDKDGNLLEEDDEDYENGVDAFETDAKNVNFVRASLKYVNDKFDDIVFADPKAKAAPKGRKGKSSSSSSGDAPDAGKKDDKAADPKAADAKSGVVDMLKKLAAPVMTSALVATGFWFSGAMPSVVAMLAKAGLTLPAVGTAAIASQVAIAAGVGLLAYGVGLAAWKFVAQPIFNAAKAAYADYKKTKKERYEDEKASLTKEVADLEAKLDPDFKDKIVDLLSKRLQKAPEAAFDGDNFAKEQPKVLNQLEVLRKEAETLRAITAANDDKRKEMEADLVKNGPKYSKP